MVATTCPPCHPLSRATHTPPCKPLFSTTLPLGEFQWIINFPPIRGLAFTGTSRQHRRKDGPPVTVTLSGHLGAIREGKYADGVNAVRVARGTAAYTQLKHLLPAVCWGAYLPDGRKQSDLTA